MRLVFVKKLYVGNRTWILTKSIELPFQPWQGMKIKEGPEPWQGKTLWEISMHSEFYYNSECNCFVCETTQNTNDIDSLLKLYLSQGWELKEEPKEIPAKH